MCGLSSIEEYRPDYHRTQLANSFFVLFALYDIRSRTTIGYLQEGYSAFSRLWCEDDVKSRSLLLRVLSGLIRGSYGVFAIFDVAFQLKFEQESSDFSQERNALFLFLYQLLSVLVPDVLLYNLFAHISQSTHVVTVAP